MEKFKSRKFIMAIASGLIVLINAILDAKGYKALNSESVLTFVGIIATYILGEGAVDAARQLKGG